MSDRRPEISPNIIPILYAAGGFFMLAGLAIITKPELASFLELGELTPLLGAMLIFVGITDIGLAKLVFTPKQKKKNIDDQFNPSND